MAKTNIRAVERKMLEQWRHKLFKYEQKHYMAWYIKDCDRLASDLVRARDCWRWLAPCVTQGISVCKWPISFKTSQCCHAIRRRYYSCRRDLRNIYAGCASCNCYWLQDHNVAIATRVIKQHGQDVRDEMRDNRSMAKPDHIEIKRIHESLKDLHNKVFLK